jgi:hypothetical protein
MVTHYSLDNAISSFFESNTSATRQQCCWYTGLYELITRCGRIIPSKGLWGHYAIQGKGPGLVGLVVWWGVIPNTVRRNYGSTESRNGMGRKMDCLSTISVSFIPSSWLIYTWIGKRHCQPCNAQPPDIHRRALKEPFFRSLVSLGGLLIYSYW